MACMSTQKLVEPCTLKYGGGDQLTSIAKPICFEGEGTKFFSRNVVCRCFQLADLRGGCKLESSYERQQQRSAPPAAKAAYVDSIMYVIFSANKRPQLQQQAALKKSLSTTSPSPSDPANFIVLRTVGSKCVNNKRQNTETSIFFASLPF